MGWSLYLVRFRIGEADPVPLTEARPVLEEFGTLSGARSEFELTSASEIAARITLDCSADGVRWMSIERPRDTPIYRSFVFSLLTKLRMTAIDPSGAPVWISSEFDLSDLPKTYQTHFVRVASEGDLLTL